MNPILEVENLTKHYHTKKGTGFTLENVSFSLPGGAIMGFIGSNGAGKTTTIKLILNLLKRESGSVKIFGLDNIKDEIAIKKDIGVVFDDLYFIQTLPIHSVDTIMKNIYQNWDSKKFKSYLNEFKLPEKKKIKDLSRGMRMKLSIALALSHHPKLLLLDEPTSGLDPLIRNEILDIFLDFICDEDHSILLSSHITSDLDKIADYITLIDDGKIIESISKEDITDHYGIVRTTEAELLKMKNAGIGMTPSIRNAFGSAVLVKEKEKVQQLFPNFVMDTATIEDVMLFQCKEKQEEEVF